MVSCFASIGTPHQTMIGSYHMIGSALHSAFFEAVTQAAVLCCTPTSCHDACHHTYIALHKRPCARNFFAHLKFAILHQFSHHASTYLHVAPTHQQPPSFSSCKTSSCSSQSQFLALCCAYFLLYRNHGSLPVSEFASCQTVRPIEGRPGQGMTQTARLLCLYTLLHPPTHLRTNAAPQWLRKGRCLSPPALRPTAACTLLPYTLPTAPHPPTPTRGCATPATAACAPHSRNTCRPARSGHTQPPHSWGPGQQWPHPGRPGGACGTAAAPGPRAAALQGSAQRPSPLRCRGRRGIAAGGDPAGPHTAAAAAPGQCC